MKIRFLAMMMVLALFFGCTAAQASSLDDFLYAESEQGVIINYFMGDYEEVEIPEQIDGGNVYSIGDNAFSNKTLLSRLHVPACVTEIGDKAFQGSPNIELVVVPGSAAETYAKNHGMDFSYDGVPGYPLNISGVRDFQKMLAAYGHIVAAIDSGYAYTDSEGMAAVRNWTNIVAVDAGFDHSVGLRKDGTVTAEGGNASGECAVDTWSDIAAVAAGGGFTVGVKKDGSVVSVGDNASGQCNVSAWANIEDVSTGVSHTVGMKKDGTVVATGDNSDGRCDVSAWTDIAAISAGDYHTVGLKKDGTVVAVGWNGLGACNVSGWTDIVAVAAGSGYTVGLKSDGTLVSAGVSKAQSQVSGMNNVLAIAAGMNQTIVMKIDGTVVVLAENVSPASGVSNWDLLL